MNLGSKITNLRNEKGLNQKQLADRAGLTQATISRIEKDKKGVRELRATPLRKIAEALDVTVDYLVGDSEYITPTQIIDGDQRVRNFVMAYKSFDQSEKKTLESFISHLKDSHLSKIAVESIPIQGKTRSDIILNEDNIFWKIKAIKRSEISDRGLPHVKYQCTVSFWKLKKGASIEIKKRDGEAYFFFSTEEKKNIPYEEETTFDSQLAGYNINEAAILNNAIEKAKKIGFEKLSD